MSPPKPDTGHCGAPTLAADVVRPKSARRKHSQHARDKGGATLLCSSAGSRCPVGRVYKAAKAPAEEMVCCHRHRNRACTGSAVQWPPDLRTCNASEPCQVHEPQQAHIMRMLAQLLNHLLKGVGGKHRLYLSAHEKAIHPLQVMCRDTAESIAGI